MPVREADRHTQSKDPYRLFPNADFRSRHRPITNDQSPYFGRCIMFPISIFE